MSSNWPSPPPPLCPGEDSQAVWPLLCRSPDGCHSEHPGKWRQRSAADGQRPVILPGVLDGSAYCQPSARRYLLVMGLCPNTLTSHHSSSHHFKILKGNDARHKSKSLKSKHIHIIGDLLLSCNSKTVDLS